MTEFSGPGDVRKLPCGCWGMLVGEQVVIDAEGFLCAHRHPQGAPLTLLDVAQLAIAKALAEGDSNGITRDSGAPQDSRPSRFRSQVKDSST